MPHQNILSENEERKEAKIFYREVKPDYTSEIKNKNLTSYSDIKDIKKLLKDIKRKLRYPTKIKDSKMNEAHKNWVKQILEEESKEDNLLEYRIIKDLLREFCDHLQKRQREKGKYAMLILYGSSILLTHVKAEKGLSIREGEEKIELIKRFLDIDNILSAALFEGENGELEFSHFTDTGSTTFRDFIGVAERKFHYKRKNVRIISFYEGTSGIECKFEFSNNELKEKWIQNNKIKISGRKLKLNNHQHHIKEISWGNKNYSNPNFFKSEFKEYIYGLENQKKHYKELRKIKDSSSFFSDIIDYKEFVEIQKKDDKKIKEKGNIPQDIHILYADKHIDIDSNFAKKILRDIVYGNKCSIFHPSENIASKELEINNVSLLNIEKTNLAPEYLNFLDKLHNNILNIEGETISWILGFVWLHMISQEVNEQFNSGINQIIKLQHGFTKRNKTITTKENSLIEYKDRDDLSKDKPFSSIIDNIEKESREINYKVFLWGIDEESRSIDGLRKQRWGDDRIDSLEEKVNRDLDDRNTEVSKFYLFSVPIGEKNQKCILVGVFYN
ncbi:hypothetical protein AMET1_1215 [Methanonatronarchaeum thermophilum]|uniref:Uncharacterized protein n=1 Tax=Methanonatronarchaeum thermophilum TaxID=1927129 RepID=A0A1Y3GDM4_9EURY|nr:hypothetical protein [Methanonatronarchaeum thermophilum]OUJ18304.1 hypothetical protein AMET1_1215 [Methanonatronarchaeum thermophilum]